jgi:hypothetical protein
MDWPRAERSLDPAGAPAQIAPMSQGHSVESGRLSIRSRRTLLKVAAVPVRIAHFFTCMAAFGIAAWTLSYLPSMLGTRVPFERGPDFVGITWITIVVLVFGVPSACAWWRVLRGRRIVSDTHIFQHPVLSTVITLSSLFAHFLVASVFFAVWSVYPDFDGNAAGPLFLALMLYAFALLSGEVLAH